MLGAYTYSPAPTNLRVYNKILSFWEYYLEGFCRNFDKLQGIMVTPAWNLAICVKCLSHVLSHNRRGCHLSKLAAAIV